MAASTIYRAWINGELVAHGPARGPHGYYRVDEIDVSKQLKPGTNVIAIEVAGYNSNSYYVLDQPSFLQAELLQGSTVLASTLGEGQPFEAGVLDYRVQKVQRYSFQRPFIEVYRLSPDSHRWITEADAPMASPVELAAQPQKNLLPRRVLFPELTEDPADAARQRRPDRASRRSAQAVEGPQPDQHRSGTQGLPRSGAGSGRLHRHAEARLRSAPDSLKTPWKDDPHLTLTADRYQVLDVGVNRTGMIGATVSCDTKTVLLFAFDEILTDTPQAKDDVNFRRLGCVNVVRYELEPGSYELESIEPYTFRYLKVICVEGGCKVEDLYLREYAHPHDAASPLRRERRAAQPALRGRRRDVPPEHARHLHGLPVARAGRLALRQPLHGPRGAGPDRHDGGREGVLRELPPAGTVRAPARRHAADVLPGRPLQRQLHPQLVAVLRARVGGVPGPKRRPGDGRRPARPRSCG